MSPHRMGDDSKMGSGTLRGHGTMRNARDEAVRMLTEEITGKEEEGEAVMVEGDVEVTLRREGMEGGRTFYSRFEYFCLILSIVFRT